MKQLCFFYLFNNNCTHDKNNGGILLLWFMKKHFWYCFQSYVYLCIFPYLTYLHVFFATTT